MTGDSSEVKGAAYCVDASSLFVLLNRGYPKDVFPSVWNKLESLVKTGRFKICQEVWDEIEPDRNEKGELKELLSLESPGKTFLLPEDQDVRNLANKIINEYTNWVKQDGKRQPADPYIIAHAKVRGMVVITEEKRKGEGQESEEKRKGKGQESEPKIPNVCTENRVESMPLLGLFRREGWRF